MDRKITGAVRIVWALCCFAAVLGCFISGILRYCLFDRAFYRQHIADEQYCQQITAFIREDVQDDCYVYRLPFSVVEQQLSQQKVGEQCRIYIDAFYDALYSGKNNAAVSYPTQGLYDAVYAYLIGQGAEQHQAQEDAAYISAALAERANENICALSEQQLMSLLSQYLFANPLLHRAANSFWILLVCAALLLVGVLRFGVRRFSVRLYVTSGILFSAAAAVFVPIWLLRRYDLPSKLVLATSPMKSLFERFWYSLQERIFLIASVGLIIAVAALVGAIWYILYQKTKSTV